MCEVLVPEDPAFARVAHEHRFGVRHAVCRTQRKLGHLYAKVNRSLNDFPEHCSECFEPRRIVAKALYFSYQRNTIEEDVGINSSYTLLALAYVLHSAINTGSLLIHLTS